MTLRHHGGKHMSLESGLCFGPSPGHCFAGERHAREEHNRYLLKLLTEKGVRELGAELTGAMIKRDKDGPFLNVASGIYRMK